MPWFTVLLHMISFAGNPPPPPPPDTGYLHIVTDATLSSPAPCCRSARPPRRWCIPARKRRSSPCRCPQTLTKIRGQTPVVWGYKVSDCTSSQFRVWMSDPYLSLLQTDWTLVYLNTQMHLNGEARILQPRDSRMVDKNLTDLFSTGSVVLHLLYLWHLSTQRFSYRKEIQIVVSWIGR